MTQFSQINSQHTRISTTTYNKTMLAIYCSIAIGVSGCSTLPEHKTLPTASVAVEPIDTSETTLAQIIEPLQQQNPNLTGYHVLLNL